MATLLLYLFLCLVWGSTWLIIRIGLIDLSPFWSLAFRIWLALLFILALGWIRKTSFALPREHRRSLWIVCLLVYPGNYCLVYWGEQFVTSGLTAVVFSCMPFCVALFSLRMLPQERPGFQSIVGLTVGFAGLATIYWDQLSLGDPQKVLGMLAISLAAAIASYNTILVRRDLGGVPAISLTAFTLLCGSVVVPLFALASEGRAELHFTGSALATIGYLSIVASGLAFVVYFRLLTHLSALTMSMIAFITPIIALLLGSLFDHEALAPRAWAGIALVLMGVLLVVQAGSRRAVRHSHPASASLASERQPEV